MRPVGRDMQKVSDSILLSQTFPCQNLQIENCLSETELHRLALPLRINLEAAQPHEASSSARTLHSCPPLMHAGEYGTNWSSSHPITVEHASAFSRGAWQFGIHGCDLITLTLEMPQGLYGTFCRGRTVIHTVREASRAIPLLGHAQ